MRRTSPPRDQRRESECWLGRIPVPTQPANALLTIAVWQRAAPPPFRLPGIRPPSLLSARSGSLRSPPRGAVLGNTVVAPYAGPSRNPPLDLMAYHDPAFHRAVAIWHYSAPGIATLVAGSDRGPRERLSSSYSRPRPLHGRAERRGRLLRQDIRLHVSVRPVAPLLARRPCRAQGRRPRPRCRG